jgi:hypothetical protein
MKSFLAASVTLVSVSTSAFALDPTTHGAISAVSQGKLVLNPLQSNAVYPAYLIVVRPGEMAPRRFTSTFLGNERIWRSESL